MSTLATAPLFEIEQAFLDAISTYEDALERQSELDRVVVPDSEAFELASAKQALSEEVDAATEALARVISAEMTKVDNIAAYDRWCEQMEAGCRAVRDQATERMRTWASRKERLRAATLRALQSCGKTKLESAMHYIRRQNSAPSVELTGEDLPEQFVRVKTIREADKRAIQQALLRGETVPGAKLLRSEHVRIA